MPIYKTKLTVAPQIFLSGAIVLLIFPIKWILAWITAVVIHEMFHYSALLLCNTQVLSIYVDIAGVKMYTCPMGKCQEFICALAGPVGSFLLLLLSRWFPYVAICGLLQAVYNLLPLFPLDGGRAVICLLQMVGEGRYSGRIYLGIKTAVFAGLLGVSIFALCNKLGLIPLLFTILLFFRIGMENPLANREK